MKAKDFLFESLSHDDTLKILKKFIPYAAKHIGLDQLPKFNFSTGHERSVQNSSFGGYGNGQINITISNRHIMDICRTLAHEMVHFKQDINNELDDNSGDTGSPAENEANALAAVIMRNWGRKYPVLFSHKSVE